MLSAQTGNAGAISPACLVEIAIPELPRKPNVTSKQA